MEVKVLHEGTLEKCSSAEDQGKKDWRRRYFVFKYFPASSTRCLEYYKDKNWRKQDPKGVLTLHPGYEVVKVHDPKKKYVFDVKTVEHVFRLSSQSEDELNKWILILEKENIVKSFVVEPVPSEVMDKTGAKHTCHLHITDTEVRLVSSQNGNQLVAWPFTCLRRYMSSRGKFSLEAGRRAPTGQGSFVFITSQHDEIYKILDNVIKSRAGKSAPTCTPPKCPAVTVQRSESMQSTQSSHTVPEEDGYDHLMCSPLAGVKPAHPAHPNYDQNILHSHKKTETQRGNDYASPYGHMQIRESLSSIQGPKDVNVVQSDGKAGEYNTLNHDIMTSKNQSSAVKRYILNPSKPQKPAPPLPLNSDLNPQAVGNQNVGSGSLYDNNESPHSFDDTNNTYDSLNHSAPLPQQGNSARMSLASAFDMMNPGGTEADEGAYNVLSHPGPPANSPVFKTQQLPQDGSQNTDEYGMLDRPNIPSHIPLRHSRSQPLVAPRKTEVSGQAIPVSPPRVPLGGNDRMSQGYDRSSVSSMSSFGSSVCPLDVSGSFRDSQLSTSDQDFYSSIDERNVSPVKSQPSHSNRGWHGTRTGPESPAEPKQVLPKPRKTRIAEQDSWQKNTQGNLVSNLKASLLADGLNLNKVIPGKIAQRRLSADVIPENGTYSEVDDGECREKGSRKTRLVRSPSAPLDPIEDIYEDPDKSSYR